MAIDFHHLVAGVPEADVKSALCVLLLNSHAEGWASSTSDIDFMFVHPGDSDSAPEHWKTYVVDGCRIDVHNVSEQELAHKVRLASAPTLDLLTVATGHKLRAAVPLRGEDAWLRLLQSFDVDAFDRTAARYHFNRLHQITEDIAGWVADGDIDSALLSAFSAINCSIDAFRASKSLTNPNEKWRISGLRRTPVMGARVLATYRDFLTGRHPAGGGDDGSLIARGLDFARRVHVLSQLEPAALEALSGHWEHQSDYRWAPFASASALQGEYILHNPGPRFRVNRVEYLCWALLPSSSSHAWLATFLGECCATELSIASIEQSAARLLKMGVLTHGVAA